MTLNAAARALAVALLLAPGIARGEERELLELWKTHLAAPDDHAAVVGACRRYVAARPNDPFVPVVHGIEAWRLLRAGRAEQGGQRLEPYLAKGDDPIREGASRLARAWNTRMLREYLVDALQFYYRREVRYPPDLATLAAYPALPDAGSLPWTDAWNRKWNYRLTGFRGVPGFMDQKFELESASIDPPTDLAAALALPYAGRIDVKPVAVTINPRSKPVTKFERVNKAKEREVLAIPTGDEAGGIFLAYAGNKLVIVCDTLHWKVLVRM